MITGAAALLWARSNWKILAGVAAAIALAYAGYRTYNSIYKAGAAGVTDAVQKKTITTIDKANRDREKAGEETRNTPYPDRVDGLR